MIMDRHSQNPFGKILANHVIIQVTLDLYGFKYFWGLRNITLICPSTFKNNLIAQLDTFITDVNSRTGNQLDNILLALTAE